MVYIFWWLVTGWTAVVKAFGDQYFIKAWVKSSSKEIIMTIQRSHETVISGVWKMLPPIWSW